MEYSTPCYAYSQIGLGLLDSFRSVVGGKSKGILEAAAEK